MSDHKDEDVSKYFKPATELLDVTTKPMSDSDLLKAVDMFARYYALEELCDSWIDLIEHPMELRKTMLDQLKRDSAKHCKDRWDYRNRIEAELKRRQKEKS